jgi:hypothetical protein
LPGDFRSGSDRSRMECRSANVFYGDYNEQAHRGIALMTPAATRHSNFEMVIQPPEETTERSLQDSPGAFVRESPHLPALRTAAWIDNPKMDSENPALAVSFRKAQIEGIPEHEPPADRRSWIILDAGFYDRTAQAMLNHNRLGSASKSLTRSADGCMNLLSVSNRRTSPRIKRTYRFTVSVCCSQVPSQPLRRHSLAYPALEGSRGSKRWRSDERKGYRRSFRSTTGLRRMRDR